MTQNQKGMTLVEVMLASFVIMVSVLGASTIGSLIYSTSSVLMSSNSRDGVRSEINRNLTNNSVWRTTYMDVNNTSMTCLRDRTDCSGVLAMADRSFRIVKFGGEVVYDPSANGGLAGFNRQGVKCNPATDGLFDATNGNYNCPLRYDLTWRPLCPPSGACIDPIVEISASVSVNSTASDKLYTIDYDLTDADNRLNFKMLLPMPQSAPPIAKTDSFIINRGETPLFDVLANDFVDEGYTLTIVSVTNANGWASISGNKIQYSPDPMYYGSDSLRYVVQDNSGKRSTGYVFVKIMTPYTWTGLAGNTDISNPQNWCGTVINGVCQGRALLAKADLVFNENCTNCSVAINTALTVSSLRMTKGFAGSIEQNASLTLVPASNWSPNVRNSEDIGPDGYMFMQEAGTYKINSGSMTVTARDFFGAFPPGFPAGTRDPRFNMIAFKANGGTFIANSAFPIEAAPSMQISASSNFQLNNAPVTLSENHSGWQLKGIDAPNVNFDDLHIKVRGGVAFWSKISAENLYWDQWSPGFGSYGTSYYCDRFLAATHRPCNCTYGTDVSSQIKGISCPESQRGTADTGEISVTGNLFVNGGGGIDGTWAASNEKPARIYLRGGLNTQVYGVPSTQTIKGALPQLFIDKSNALATVTLNDDITFVDRFERINGTIVANTNSRVIIDTRQYHSPVLDLKGAELWNLDMNEGNSNSQERWANINSDVYVNGTLRFPSLPGWSTPDPDGVTIYGGGVNYYSNCGAVYAKGDVYLGSGHNANGAFTRNAACPTSFSPSGRHVLDLVLTGNANQNIFQEAGKNAAGFGNLYIQKTGGIVNFNAGSYGLVGDLNITCTACTNFSGSTLKMSNTHNQERAPRIVTNGATLGSVIFKRFATPGGNGSESRIIGDLFLSGDFTTERNYVKMYTPGTKIFVAGNVTLKKDPLAPSNRWPVGDYIIQFTNGSGDQNLNIDNALYGFAGPPVADKLENHLFVEINKSSGQVVLQNNLKAANVNIMSGTLFRNSFTCDVNGVACSGGGITKLLYPDLQQWIKNLNSNKTYPHTQQSSYNMRIAR